MFIAMPAQHISYCGLRYYDSVAVLSAGTNIAEELLPSDCGFVS